MSRHRIGSIRLKNARRVWVASTLGLGAVAATTGVAMASAHSEGGSGREGTDATRSVAASRTGSVAHLPSARPSSTRDDDRRRAKLCVKLDPAAQKAITAAIEAGKGKTVEIPMSKTVLVACSPKVKPPVTTAPTATKPIQPPMPVEPPKPTATLPTMTALPVAPPAPVAPTTQSSSTKASVSVPKVKSAGS